MTLIQLISTTILFVLISIISIGFGLLIIEISTKLLKLKNSSEANNLILIGTGLLVGLGGLGNISLIVGLLGAFNLTVISFLLLFIFLLSRNHIYLVLKIIIKEVKNLISNFRKNIFLLSLLVIITGIISSLYLASMQPPHASDELHYHFPHAEEIIQLQKINFQIGGHYFYGNIPNLMEVIYAFGIAVSGYSFAHSLHLLFLIGFLLIASGLSKKYFNNQSAIYAALFLLLFNHYTWNATVGFVDSATVSLELASLLFAIEWYLSKKKKSIVISAIFIGFALSMKYSPLFTLIFIIGIITINNFYKRKKFVKNLVNTLLLFGIVTFIVGGYWYVKNLILYKNPIYPMYFGHVDVSKDDYQRLVRAIQQFKDRSFENFLLSPTRYLKTNQLTPFLSFLLAPLAIFVKKKSAFTKLLLAYFLIYFSYWFFLATHQIRFLMPATMVGLILMALVIGQIKSKTAQYAVFVALLLSASFYQHNLDRKFNISLTKFISYFPRQAGFQRIGYALGTITEEEFLLRRFKCQYNVILELDRREAKGNVIDNWTVWHDPSVAFYTKDNKFIQFSTNLNTTKEELVDSLNQKNIQYIYFNAETKKRFFARTDPYRVNYRKGRDKVEENLLEHSQLIYESTPCKLFKIDKESFL